MPLKHSIADAGKRLRRALASFAAGKDATRGTAAIEFAIVGSVMVTLLVAGADLGLAFYSDMQVETSAQSGAEYAAVHGFDATSISSAVTHATSSSGIAASPAPFQFCGCVSGSAVAGAACGSVCPDGMTAGTYVTVTATRTYSTLIPYPSLPASFTQTSTSTVRIQ